MQQGSSKNGIFGGTFNPIHNGHLIIAEAVREQFGLDRVIFMPSGTPPHKKDSEVTHAAHRLNMVKCAIQTNPFFEASNMETDREGRTYTVDTLTRLKACYGEDNVIYFIAGADVIVELTTWKDYNKVFSMCEFITVARSGHCMEELVQDIAQIKEKYPVVIHAMEAPLIEISSSSVRDQVKAGKSIKYLVPECVEEYIRLNGLYK